MCIIVEVAVRSKTSTTITLAWSEADYTAMKTVNISWMIDDSLCMYDEDVDGQTTNNTVAPYVITELKAHSSYIITVCVEDLVCKSVTETTRESGTDKKHPNYARKNIFFLQFHLLLHLMSHFHLTQCQVSLLHGSLCHVCIVMETLLAMLSCTKN